MPAVLDVPRTLCSKDIFHLDSASLKLTNDSADEWWVIIPGSGMWVCWDWGLLLHAAKLSTAQASINYIKPLPCSTASLTKLEWSWPREGWLHLVAGLLRPAVCQLSGACTGWHRGKLPSKDSCASNQICLFPMHSEWKFILICPPARRLHVRLFDWLQGTQPAIYPLEHDI